MYDIPWFATGTLTVGENLTVTLTGDCGPFEDLTITVGKNTRLTLQNVTINGDRTLLSLAGGNTLLLAGENRLDGTGDAANLTQDERLETAALGVELCCQRPATALQRTNTGWRVITAAGAVETKAVLVCTGGAAAPALGGSAEAYGLLTDLGLAKTPLFPSIVQLRTDTALVRAVKGIRVDAGVELRLDGAVQAQNTGEVLFTDYGLSGPAVMQVSRVAGDWERRQRGTLTAVLDLLPDWKLPMLEKRIGVRSRLPGRTLEDLLTGLLHKRVGQTVLRAAGVLPLTRPADTLTPAECHRAAALCKGWELPVLGTKGFGGAQVTAGGINARQIDPQTMGLRGFPGLFAAGEVLDVDGDCGGFNLQFAFSSAYVAATAIAAGWR